MQEIQLEEDDIPVTDADLAAHHALASLLKLLLPKCSVVAEEDAGSMVYRQPLGRFWFIDPLDGTKEFIARNGEFTVNIALIEDGRCMLGVVHTPAIDALYWGCRLGGVSMSGRSNGCYRGGCFQRRKCTRMGGQQKLQERGNAIVDRSLERSKPSLGRQFAKVLSCG